MSFRALFFLMLPFSGCLLTTDLPDGSGPSAASTAAAGGMAGHSSASEGGMAVTSTGGGASSTTSGGAGGTPTMSDCCEAHPRPGCDAQRCNYCVCMSMAVCCQVSWTIDCVQTAQDACSGSCDCGPMPGPASSSAASTGAG